jgi:hypothetical protein
VDSCKDNFSANFRDQNGRWQPISLAGQYSEQKLRLNTVHLIEVRRMLYQRLKEMGAPSINWDKPLTPQIAPYLRQLVEVFPLLHQS